MELKICTWNINRSSFIWKYLQEQIQPDIYLLQEYQQTSDAGRPNSVNVIHNSVDGKPNYWDAVIATQDLSITPISIDKYRGRVILGKVTLPDNQQMCILNIHAQSLDGCYVKWTCKLLDLLEPLILANKSNLIIGGDLNMGLFFDRTYGGTDNRDLIDRLTSYGLTMYPQLEQQTYRHRRKLEPQYPDDYLFVSNSRTASCEVLSNESVQELSDHNPVVIKLMI